MEMRVVLLGCALILAACADADGNEVASVGSDDPVASETSTTGPASASVAFVEGTDVRAYFDSADFLSAPEIGDLEPDQFAWPPSTSSQARGSPGRIFAESPIFRTT